MNRIKGYGQTGVVFLRLLNPTNPTRAVPNSQAATALDSYSAQQWECRDTQNPRSVLVTLEQTSNDPLEISNYYPAVVTDGFGERHKATMAKNSLTRTWIWGKSSRKPVRLDDYRWQSHCRGLYQLPVAA